VKRDWTAALLLFSCLLLIIACVRIYWELKR
jgi:hypothetical protein